jgi:transposase
LVEQILKPYQEQIKGIVVESTYNWYWLVDGLIEEGYRMHLANPSAIKQYAGLKHSDDVTDAFHLARNLGKGMNGNDVKKLSEDDVEQLFGDEHLVVAGKASIATIVFLSDRIRQIEKIIHKVAKLKDEYRLLITAPGIHKILALTIMYETGPIERLRFKKVGNYASYCRCVGSKRISNEKVKGKGNRRNGNKHLSRAYVEAAHHAMWHYEYVQRYYQKKMVKTNTLVARKTIAHKLARACYYIIRDQTRFDPARVFV